MVSSKILSGNRRIILVGIAISGIITLITFLFEPLLAGIPAIICGSIIMIAVFSEDAARNARPMLGAELSPDLSEIIIENLGSADAEGVEVRIQGADSPYKIGTLAADEKSKIQLPGMTERITAVVTYHLPDGEVKKRVFKLGDLGQDYDPFQPVFPLFNWKGKE